MGRAASLLVVAAVTGVGQEGQWRLWKAMGRHLATSGGLLRTLLWIAFFLGVGALVAWSGGLPWILGRLRWRHCLLPALAAGIASTLAVDYPLLFPLTAKYGKLAVELGQNIAMRTVAFGFFAMLVAWLWAAWGRRTAR